MKNVEYIIYICRHNSNQNTMCTMTLCYEKNIYIASEFVKYVSLAFAYISSIYDELWKSLIDYLAVINKFSSMID